MFPKKFGSHLAWCILYHLKSACTWFVSYDCYDVFPFLPDVFCITRNLLAVLLGVFYIITRNVYTILPSIFCTVRVCWLYYLDHFESQEICLLYYLVICISRNMFAILTVVQRCCVKKVFLRNSQETTCAGVSFLIKLQNKFCKIFQNTFSYRTHLVVASVHFLEYFIPQEYACYIAKRVLCVGKSASYSLCILNHKKLVCNFV